MLIWVSDVFLSVLYSHKVIKQVIKKQVPILQRNKHDRAGLKSLGLSHGEGILAWWPRDKSYFCSMEDGPAVKGGVSLATIKYQIP